LLTLMDGLKGRGKVIVIGATNRPDAIDPALRRPGRFDRELEVGVPDKQGRKEILQIHTRGMPIEPDFEPEAVQRVLEELKHEGRISDEEYERLIDIDVSELKGERVYAEIRGRLIDALLEEIAEKTHGFVGADLAALAREAAMVVLRRLIREGKVKPDQDKIPPEVLQELRVRRDDFYEALKMVEPSALRAHRGPQRHLEGHRRPRRRQTGTQRGRRMAPQVPEEFRETRYRAAQGCPPLRPTGNR